MAETSGTKALKAKGVEFKLHPYDYDPRADAVGLAAAQALGLDPALTLKTLMVEVDGKPACCVIPSDRQLSMKKVAATGTGSAKPLVSTRMWSKGSGLASNFCKVDTRSLRTSTTQQMQPLTT